MSIVDKQVVEVIEEEEFASLEDMPVEGATEVEDNSDNIEENIESPDAIEDNLPSKFKGKSIDDVVKSYTELEKEFGRRNNEVGELRKLTDELLNLQLSEQKAEAEPEYTVDVDSLLDNPNETISKAVENHPKFKQFEEAQRAETITKAKATFAGKHPNWQETVQNTDFIEWIQESPVRTQMFQSANANYDYAVGDELFTTYETIRGKANTDAEEKKKGNASKALKAGSVEKGSGQSSTKSKVYRRADLINLKLTNPAKYAALEPEIMKAYAEKRVR